MTTRRLPSLIWLLGLVSFCMDLSSEMVHGLLPVYLTTVLGAGPSTVGLIEGVAEATASLTKIFSGALSDRLRNRKNLVVLGYGLAALTKPLFPLATSTGWVLFARFADRIGKGIRGAPRDALIADVTPPEMRGAAYGLRQALDTCGAFLGPLVAIALMGVFASNIRSVFWIATLPAFVAVVVLVVAVTEPDRRVDSESRHGLAPWGDLSVLGRRFWGVVAVGALITLSRFSEAFLVLRVHDAGLSLQWTPLALLVMNFTYLATAYPFGRLSDKVDRFWLMAGGLSLLVAADLLLGFGANLLLALLGVALWGIHMGLTQGLLAAMVADAAPAAFRGSAFGVFYFVTGIATLLASLIAGLIWQWQGSSVTFFVGAVFAGLALVALCALRTRFTLIAPRDDASFGK